MTKKRTATEVLISLEERVDIIERMVRSIDMVETINKKRVVQEKLIYGDGKNIVMAQIEIFNTKGKLIDKRRTNHSGKWTTSLMPGTYIIRVAKTATSSRPSATGQYEIVVEPESKPLQLGIRTL